MIFFITLGAAFTASIALACKVVRCVASWTHIKTHLCKQIALAILTITSAASCGCEATGGAGASALVADASVDTVVWWTAFNAKVVQQECLG